MPYGKATRLLKSSPVSDGSTSFGVQCRPDFRGSPASGVALVSPERFECPRSPTVNLGNGAINSPVSSLAINLISNLAVHMSPRFKPLNSSLLHSMASTNDPQSCEMDVDTDPKEALSGNERLEEQLGMTTHNGSPDGGAGILAIDDVDVDDGSPLGRLKPGPGQRQAMLSSAVSVITPSLGLAALQDGQRSANSKRPISSLNQPFTPASKFSGRNPFGSRELTSHWAQRRPSSSGRERSKLKMISTPSSSQKVLNAEIIPMDGQTATTVGSAPTEELSSASGADTNLHIPLRVDAPPAKFRRTQSAIPSGLPATHWHHAPPRHCNSLPAAPTIQTEGSTILPSIETGKDALKRISASTLVDLLDGRYKDKYDEHYIIDCRFPYEFEGGRIPTAVNVNTMDALERMFIEKPITDKKVILVFHCEFSSQRAPRMALHLRNQDRRMNVHNYPNLHYPEVYILDGGYKEFFAEYKERCSPQAYVQMSNENFKEECKAGMNMYRSSFKRSKSYTEGPTGNRDKFRRSASFTSASSTALSSKSVSAIF